MSSITSANAIILLSVTNLFPVPVQLEGFMADDIYDTEEVSPVETVMGADGKLSAGYTPFPTKQSFSIQADSASAAIFDAWQAAQSAATDVYFANATVLLPGLGTSYTQKRGALTGYKAIPDAKKILQGRKFTITWESVVPAVV